MIGAELEGAGVVVNTSNKGAQPNERFSAFAPMTGDAEADMAVSLANLERLPRDAIVADILLEDMPLTLKLAAGRGNPTHSGRHMQGCGHDVVARLPHVDLVIGIDADPLT